MAAHSFTTDQATGTNTTGAELDLCIQTDPADGVMKNGKGVAAPIGDTYTQWFGSAGNAIADDSVAWQAAIDSLAPVGGGTLRVANKYVKTYINSHIVIGSDIRFIVDGEIIFGAHGRISITGNELEIAGVSEHLTIAASVGDTVINLVSTTGFVPGSYAIIRGNKDQLGVARATERVFIKAVDPVNKTVTLSRPMTDAYPLTWPNSPWTLLGNVDASHVVGVVSVGLSANVSAGVDVLPVVDASAIAVDGFFLLMDGELGSDTPLNPSNNNLHQESVRVVAVDTVNNTVSVDHEIHHSYTTAYGAALLFMEDVKNSSVENAVISYNDISDISNHSLDISGARNCTLVNCHVIGSLSTGFGNVGSGFRLDVGLNNVIDKCSVSMPSVTGPGEGYGFSLVGSTGCKVVNSMAIGCRHSFLFFKGAAGNTVSNNTSYGCLNSDYDFHGSNEINNVVEGNVAVGTTRITTDSSGHGVLRIGNSFHLNGAHNNTVRGNTAYNNNGTFIDIQVGSSGNIVEGNTAHNVIDGITLTLPGSTKNGGLPYDPTLTAVGNSVLRNTIVGCVRGIVMDGQANQTIYNNLINDNVIKGCTGNSILVTDAPNNSLIGNELYPIPIADVNNVLNWAVRIVRSINTVMDDTVIEGSQDGIYLSGGSTGFIGDAIKFKDLVGKTVFRTGSTDLNSALTNHLVRGFTPLWSLSTVSSPMIAPPYQTRKLESGVLTLPATITGALISPSNVEPVSTDGVALMDFQYVPVTPMTPISVHFVLPYVSIDTSDTVTLALFVNDQLPGSTLDLKAVSTERVTAGTTAGNSMHLYGTFDVVNVQKGTAIQIMVRIGERSGTKTLTVGGKYVVFAQPQMHIIEG